MDIAVIGGGIAGLTAAWLLSRRHRVTLFERQTRPGFVASSVAVNPATGRLAQAGADAIGVDVPLRVFYPGYYPQLMRLYQDLGVASEPVNYASTLLGSNGEPYFRWRNLRWGDISVPYVLPHDLGGTAAWRIVAGALRFRRLALAAQQRGELTGCTLGEFVVKVGLAPEFVNGLLLPTLATVATCSHQDALAYPADVVAGYLAAGVARQSVRRAVNGADDVAHRLVAPVHQVVCNADVQDVEQREDGVWLRGRLDSEGQAAPSSRRFDHVVLATQANQALALWRSASAAEHAALAGFSYRQLDVVMHRDESFMPGRRADWSAVNARVCAEQERPQSTIWINAVQPALRRAPPVLQTVMPHRPPRDEQVLAWATFERPLVTASSQRALTALEGLHQEPGRRVWLCGSYAHRGVPLLESAVRSAFSVAARLLTADGVVGMGVGVPTAVPAGAVGLNETTSGAGELPSQRTPGLRASQSA